MINGVGLGVVISGVALFNAYKLQRIVKVGGCQGSRLWAAPTAPHIAVPT